MDAATELRDETIQALETMGIEIEYSHHEVAPSQHEIDMRYNDALAMADHTITYRLVVKEIAAKNGCYATFMPKPIFGENGSGMHTHQSLFTRRAQPVLRRGRQVPPLDGRRRRSSPASSRTRASCRPCFAQWVNSYKRLVPGYEAPVYVAWSQRNRSALIRIPLYKPGSEQATRAEIRCPDPACNPYLAFAALLHAGLEGIEKDYELPEPMETNLYHLTDEGARSSAASSRCPRPSARRSRSSPARDLMRKALGDHIFDALRRAQAQGVGRVPDPGQCLGARPVPLGPLAPFEGKTRRRRAPAAASGSSFPLEGAHRKLRIASRSTRRSITRLALSIRPIAAAGTSLLRLARKPARTDSASGMSGVVPYIGHSTRPTTLPRRSATRNPDVAFRSMASAPTTGILFAVCNEIPPWAVKSL